MESQQNPIFLHFDLDRRKEETVELLAFVKEKKIKMVYLDFGGTLVDLSETIKERVVKKINEICGSNISIGEFTSEVKNEWSRRESPIALKNIKLVTDNKQEKEYWIGFFSKVLNELGIRGRYPSLLKWLATVHSNPKSFVVFPFVQEMLESLEKMGVRMGIISNAFPSTRRILKESGLIQRFDEQHIILSCELNTVKPEKSIYQKAIEKAKVKPQEVLFIDDRKSFVEGAVKFKMKAVTIVTGGHFDLEANKNSGAEHSPDRNLRENSDVGFVLRCAGRLFARAALQGIENTYKSEISQNVMDPES
jgi:HAD superfamily hydrolase (TIGR01509 family)